MTIFSKFERKNQLILIFLIGILISSFYAIYNLNKFDKNEGNSHLMVRGDINLIWKEAESFKKDIIETKSFFGNGIEYTRTFLPSKLIAIYSIITNQDLYEDYENKIIKINGKMFYLLFQILFYYLCLLFLYKRLLYFYDDKNLIFYIIAFLALDPNILQWHGTFWTESIFISFQILLIGMTIKSNKTNLFCLCLGLFLGLVFLQKTVGIFFIFFIALYIFFSEQKNYKLKIVNIFLGFAIILTLLGYDNYKKTGIFYVMPLQTKGAHYGYFIVQIYNKKNELKLIDQLQKSEEEWKVKNNYSEDNFQSRYDLGNFQQKKAIKIILNNKIITMQIYLKKIIHHAVLNPFQTFYWHKYNQKDYYGIEFHLSKESKKYFIFKIFYSLIFYIILFVGIFSFIKKRNKLDFHLLIFFLVLYLVFMLGWVGNSRYFIPSVVFLSIFFGHGLNYFNKLRYKKS
jgi:hypothetical protein